METTEQRAQLKPYSILIGIIVIMGILLSGCEKQDAAEPKDQNIFSDINLEEPKSFGDTIEGVFQKVDAGEISLDQAYEAFEFFIQADVNNKDLLMPLLKGAAQRGHPKAQRSLGLNYARGIYTPQDIPEAKEWLTLSALQEDEKAQIALANLYYNSKYGAINLPAAAKWFEIAGKKGNATAQWYTAVIYSNGGTGLKADSNKAYEYALLSASQQFVYAESLLGQWFYNGFNVEKDLNQSLKYYDRAAKQGYPEAMAWVGTLYLGEPHKDLPRSYAWYTLAAEHGHKEAITILSDDKNRSWGLRLISSGFKPPIRAEGKNILEEIRTQITKSNDL